MLMNGFQIIKAAKVKKRIVLLFQFVIFLFSTIMSGNEVVKITIYVINSIRNRYHKMRSQCDSTIKRQRSSPFSRISYQR